MRGRFIAIRVRSRSGRGFTLVELLVVVSIIALLIAILLPSLKKARKQAKDVICKANMKSIGQAFTMYAEANHGVWPPAIDTFGLQNRWPVPFHKSKIITAEFATFDSNGKTITSDPSIFLCPEERADRGIPNWNGTTEYVDRVEVGGSYALNEEIHRNGDELDRGYFPPPTAKPPFVNKIDNCRRAGSVFALMENEWPIKSVGSPGWRFHRGWSGDAGSGSAEMNGSFYQGWRMPDGAAPPTDAFQFFRIVGERHSGRGNGLMIDTHVEAYRPENVSYNQVSWETWKGEFDEIPGGK